LNSGRRALGEEASKALVPEAENRHAEV